MKRVVIITASDADYGFLLAGISQFAVDPADAAEALEKAMGDQETGLIIVDERLMNSLVEEEIHQVQYSWHGILLVLPSPVRPSAVEEDYAIRLIKRALGYHVRLKL